MTTKAFIGLFVAILSLSVSRASSEQFLGAPCDGSLCDNGMECLALGGGECLFDGVDPKTLCSCGGAGGESDPYFTGFAGQSFYFKAEAGNTYSLFSESTHSVNAHFVATELPVESDLVGLLSGVQNSSFIETVALSHGNTTVEVSADKNGEVSVQIDGSPVSLGTEVSSLELKLMLAEDFSLTIDKSPVLFGTYVSLETELLAMNIFPERVHVDNMGSTVRGHLSLQMSLKVSHETAPPAHGVLGQTIDPALTATIEDAFPGEGEASDYIVSSLHATDCSHNLFGITAGNRMSRLSAPVGASRRLLSGASQQQELRTLRAAFGSNLDNFRRRSSLRKH